MLHERSLDPAPLPTCISEALQSIGPLYPIAKKLPEDILCYLYRLNVFFLIITLT